MPFSTVASYSIDKESNVFGLSCEDLDADFFDQFVTFEPIDKEGPNYSHLDNSPHLDGSTQQNSIGETSSSWRDSQWTDSTAKEPSWHWALSQKQGSPPDASGHFYSESSGRAANSDSELLSLQNISLGSPISPLSPQSRAHSLPSPHKNTSATAARRRACITDPIPKVLEKPVNPKKSLRSPIRKSPKMVRGSQSFHGSLDLSSKFHFDFEHPMIPLSPPQSGRVSDGSDTSMARIAKENSEDFAYSNTVPHFNNRNSEYDTPLATPILDGQHSRKTSIHQPFSDGMYFPPTPQFNQGSGTWSQIPGSSEFSSFGIENDTPMWWNHAATAPMAQPSPTALHINPRRASRSLANQLHNDGPLDTNGLSCSPNLKMPTGLMIQMPESPAQPFVITSPNMQSPHMAQQGYFGHIQTQSHHQYPPPPTPYMIGGALAHTQHSSPMHNSRQSPRQSESPSPKNASSAFQVRKNRKAKPTKSTSRPLSCSSVDFVNFTPNDSRKILTGVAPSGSSKTKARREMEAMEKRRRLSMAALRAVRAAGGDVDSLVEQGLFI